MWQAQILYKNDNEKEKILNRCYFFNINGIWEREREIVVYFEKEEELKEFKKSLDDGDILYRKVRENIKWNSIWKKFHKPLRIKPFFIVPSFSRVKTPKGYKRVVIKPSFAFGTGSHVTTKLCITYLVKYLKKGWKVLDLGTGTGILAICAEKLGVSEIYAVDIDELALKEAKNNLKINKCKKKIKVERSIDELNNYFDLCVCNIAYDELVKLKPFIERKLVRNGLLILSGLLDNQEKDILEHYLNGFNLIDKKLKKDKNFIWLALVLSKR